MNKKIFSGVQPTGNLHLGNYLGAIKNFVQLQNDKKNECIYCVVDLHSITAKQDPKILKKNIRETTATFIASGLDPERSIIFNQSAVPAHAEGSWILGCVSRMGWLSRMTQFKEKAGKDKEKVSVGLYVYPVLMAADILLYDATHVPIGEDQKQHLELCRNIAQKFNHDFNAPSFLKVPEPLIQKEFARIMSLKDGLKKMSKSDPSDFSRINLSDDKRNDLKNGTAFNFRSCEGHFFEPILAATGEVKICTYHPMDKRLTFGNIYDSSFKEIWSSEQRKEAIKFIRSFNYKARCQVCCKLSEPNKLLDFLKHPEETKDINFL